MNVQKLFAKMLKANCKNIDVTAIIDYKNANRVNYYTILCDKMQDKSEK